MHTLIILAVVSDLNHIFSDPPCYYLLCIIRRAVIDNEPYKISGCLLLQALITNGKTISTIIRWCKNSKLLHLITSTCLDKSPQSKRLYFEYHILDWIGIRQEYA
ncbi:hypothetical protein D3C84_1028020 [compost metagenome]